MDSLCIKETWTIFKLINSLIINERIKKYLVKDTKSMDLTPHPLGY